MSKTTRRAFLKKTSSVVVITGIAVKGGELEVVTARAEGLKEPLSAPETLRVGYDPGKEGGDQTVFSVWEGKRMLERGKDYLIYYKLDEMAVYIRIIVERKGNLTKEQTIVFTDVCINNMQPWLTEFDYGKYTFRNLQKLDRKGL